MLIARNLSLAEIAKVSGVSRPTVSKWKKATGLPSNEARQLLERNLGIPSHVWDEALAPGEVLQSDIHKVGHRTAPVAPRRTNAQPSRQPAPVVSQPPATYGDPVKVKPFPPYPDAPLDPTTLEEVRHSLACIRHDLVHRDYTSVARSKVRADEIRTLGIIHKLEIANEMKEDRYVTSHPAWRKVRKCITTALEPFPDAASAVLVALQGLEE